MYTFALGDEALNSLRGFHVMAESPFLCQKKRLMKEQKLVMVGAQLPIYISLGGQTRIVGPTPTLRIQVFTFLVCYSVLHGLPL